MTRKSQAALEFLTTYAWAFLVILIMVGALAYFGILSPSRLLPDRCNFGSEISCVDFSMTDGTTGTVNLRLKNNVGEPINVDIVSMRLEDGTAYCTAPPSLVPLQAWTAGGIQDIAWTVCDADAVGFIAGDKAKVLVTVTYHLSRSSTTYSHEVAGEVFATVTVT